MLRSQGMDDPDLLSCLLLPDVPGAILLCFSIIHDLLQPDNNRSHHCHQWKRGSIEVCDAWVSRAGTEVNYTQFLAEPRVLRGEMRQLSAIPPK